MFLQGDKQTATLTRERASRALFGDDPVTSTSADTYVNFSNSHDVTEFNNLVESKYSNTFGSSSLFSTPESATDTPDSVDATATSEQTFATYFTTQSQYTPPVPEVQKYYNDSNPIPQQYHAFKPKMFTDFEELIVPSPKGELDEALLQKIDEIQVYEPTEATTKVAFEAGANMDTDTETYLKLNKKGIIACVTFIAITMLIIFLVIYNSIAINGAGNQIRRLRHENTELQQQQTRAEVDRMEALRRGEAAAHQFAGSGAATPPAIENLPPISSFPLTPSNPDASTNFFDQVSRFFSGLFR